MPTVDELNTIRNKAEKAKENYLSSKGRHEGLLERLKGEYGVNSLEEAEQLLKNREDEVARMQESLNERYDNLVASHEWIAED